MPTGTITWVRPSGSTHELTWEHETRDLSEQEKMMQVALSEIRSSNHCKDCRRKMHVEKKLCRKNHCWNIEGNRFSYKELVMLKTYCDFIKQLKNL